MSQQKSIYGRPWSKKADPGPWDVIVIGSGMGGMCTAAILAKTGKRVLVLEQHYVPGGFTHAFKRKGWSWDVGVHAVGEVTHHSMPGRLLTVLTDNRLQWASLGSVYEEFRWDDGFELDFPDNPEQFIHNLTEPFPDESQAVLDYMQLCREVARSMRGYFGAKVAGPGLGWALEQTLGRKANKYLAQHTRDVLPALTQDPRLQALFVAQWGYYGSPPSRSSFAIQALVTRHFMHGAYYPVGGSQRIAWELLQTVANCDGWTRVVADVDQIVVEHGKAVGVRMSTGEEIRAPTIVSAIGASATVQRLLPESFRERNWSASIASLKPAPAHVCLYIGFKGDIRSAGCSGANKWFLSSWDIEQGEWTISPSKPIGPAPVLYCSFPSLKDPTHDPGPEQRHTGEVVTFVPWECFAPWRDTRWRKRGEDYEAFKARIAEQMLEQFLQKIPALRPMVAYSELSTPLSTDTFCRPVAGSIYGLEPTPERFANPHLRPRSPVGNLYFSGSEVATVGVVGAMMGGVMAALAAGGAPARKLLADAR
ncbi:MAG: NAD(P)/FAD-dependent oxidoreductase [Myxococcota bacterium]|nr:NAD(P)/FAD-dependent oxidoreductase [Myxococcota bacterium]